VKDYWVQHALAPSAWPIFLVLVGVFLLALYFTDLSAWLFPL
jgi:hypothetical protein